MTSFTHNARLEPDAFHHHLLASDLINQELSPRSARFNSWPAVFGKACGEKPVRISRHQNKGQHSENLPHSHIAGRLEIQEMPELALIMDKTLSDYSRILCILLSCIELRHLYQANMWAEHQSSTPATSG